MKASFIIRFHTERIDNLIQILRIMSVWHEDIIKDSELITVCQDTLTTSLPVSHWGTHRNFNLDLDEMRLPQVTNFGVDQTTCDKIFLLDSDRILPKGYFADVLNQIKEGIQISIFRSKKLDNPHSDEQIINDELQFTWDNHTTTNDLTMKGMWSGNTAFIKSDFIKSGKMDEGFFGYGWEDTDMCLATQKAGIESIYREETEIHLWHPRMTYGTTKDQKKLFVDSGIRFCKKWNKPLPQILRQAMLDYRGDIL